MLHLFYYPFFISCGWSGLVTIADSPYNLYLVCLWCLNSLNFRVLLLLCSAKDGEVNQDEDYILSNPYHLVTFLTQFVLIIVVHDYL